MLKPDHETTVNTWLLLLALFTTLLLGFEFGKRVYIEEQLNEPVQTITFGRNGGPSIAPDKPDSTPIWKLVWDLMSEE
ncbi:hypothetical protein HG263_21805 [Pseudoalteromonas sp. JBTF-M23]|uniref:Uncharacterized protein n=1 Tax=Pseudoalteromonas caenipelagi TaxID=2726988 RepID=A0A849VJW8_9GAMM|nr:hypothetical protein [Pseudoalteromonas caenipelagi]NOU53140.1 hypothetical protein [Pseudoalteromonas caenipelagi]